jgi:hypothetical protein
MVAYMMLTLAEESEETQKRGLVGLLYFVGGNKLEFDRDFHTRVPGLLDWIPLRVAGVHLCSNDGYLNAFNKLLTATMGRDRRVRLRIHDGESRLEVCCPAWYFVLLLTSFQPSQGSHTEVQYSMMTFGVPVQALPITNEGELKLANHRKWIARRKARDMEMIKTGSFEGIDVPSHSDILLGRGRVFQDHPGSVKLRSWVTTYVDEFKTASKQDKALIKTRIVESMKGSGARFLKRRSDGWWEEVSEDAALEKVGASFRTIMSALSKEHQTNAPARFAEMGNRKRSRILDETFVPCFPCETCFSGVRDAL